MKPFVCIFAHPDDEAFGPGGTIAKLTKTHAVHIICVTRGDAGARAKDHEGKNLGDIRENEMRKSCEILGVKEIHFLGYADGTVCNNLYHEIAEKIKKILDQLRPSDILTFEKLGVSGHIDHIAVSLISSFLFERTDYLKKIMYFCNPSGFEEHFKNYFVWFPPGYPRDQIDEVVDVNALWDTKVRAMREHKSQIHDIEMLLPILESFPHEENFLVARK